MDPIAIAAGIAGSLVEPLGKLIAEELADGQKSEREATHAALVRLAADHAIPAVLPVVEAAIAEAEKTAAERDADATTPIKTA